MRITPMDTRCIQYVLDGTVRVRAHLYGGKTAGYTNGVNGACSLEFGSASALIGVEEVRLIAAVLQDTDALEKYVVPVVERLFEDIGLTDIIDDYLQHLAVPEAFEFPDDIDEYMLLEDFEQDTEVTRLLMLLISHFADQGVELQPKAVRDADVAEAICWLVEAIA